jgi:hypothetical protein
MKIKVTLNSGNEQFLFFSEIARKSVMAKYNQLVSEGEIQAFELV